MINITAINFKVTEGIESHIINRMSKFNKFLQKNNKMNVVLESNKYGKKAEASFKLNNKQLRASVLDDDLYVAVDLLADKINNIVDKNVGKNNSINRESSIRFMDPISLTKENLKNEEEEFVPRIVKRKPISSKPMFEEEAIEQMELLDHRSFIFYNASTEKISMLYRRHDGDYGILETD